MEDLESTVNDLLHLYFCRAREESNNPEVARELRKFYSNRSMESVSRIHGLMLRDIERDLGVARRSTASLYFAVSSLALAAGSYLAFSEDYSRLGRVLSYAGLISAISTVYVKLFHRCVARNLSILKEYITNNINQIGVFLSNNQPMLELDPTKKRDS